MKKRLMNNLTMKIAAVLSAVIFWLIVVNEIDPIEKKTFPNVVVSMVHDEIITNKGNIYRVVAGNTVSVEVTATRSVLEDINIAAIKATADIKDIQLNTLVPIKVKIAGFEGKYKAAVATPDNVEIKIETSTSKRFPISIETVGSQQDGLVLGDCVAKPETAVISGPMSLIGRIDKVVARVDINGISKDTTLGGDLILYDSAGNIIDQTTLTNNIGGDGKVQVKIKMLSTKSVNIKVNPYGLKFENGYQIGEITCEPQKIKIAGNSKDLAEIQELEISALSLRLGKIDRKTEVTVDITKVLPDNIRLANENEKNVIVTIRVEQAGVKSFEIPISALRKNVPENFKADFGAVQIVTLHLMGDDKELEKLTMDQLLQRTYIDLKECKEEKTYRVPIRVAFPDGITFAEEPYITVTMRKVKEEAQTEE